MPISRLRRNRKPRNHRVIRAGDRTMTFVPESSGDDDGIETPSVDEIEAALHQVPSDLTWDWVSPRLIPVFERGYGEGASGDPMVNSVSHVGVGIGYGIDFGPVIGRVTQSMARKWEASVEQIEHAAFQHLAEVVSAIGRADLQQVVNRGHFFRLLGRPGGWASSVVLAGEAELIRIFGTRDAVFTVPSRNALLAFGRATPPHAVAEVTIHVESIDPHPLELDPFHLVDGVLRWEGLDEQEFGIVEPGPM